MKRIVITLLLTGTALAGGREPGPPKPVQATQLTGRAFDRQFAGAMQIGLRAALDNIPTVLHLSKNPAVRAEAQAVRNDLKRDIAALQLFQKREGYSVGAYGIACGVGPQESKVDEWFLHSQASMNRYITTQATAVFTRSKNPQLKAFASDFIKRRNAESQRLSSLMDTLE